MIKTTYGTNITYKWKKEILVNTYKFFFFFSLFFDYDSQHIHIFVWKKFLLQDSKDICTKKKVELNEIYKTSAGSSSCKTHVF